MIAEPIQESAVPSLHLMITSRSERISINYGLYSSPMKCKQRGTNRITGLASPTGVVQPDFITMAKGGQRSSHRCIHHHAEIAEGVPKAADQYFWRQPGLFVTAAGSAEAIEEQGLMRNANIVETICLAD